MKSTLLLCLLFAGIATIAQNRLLDQPITIREANVRVDANLFHANTIIELIIINQKNTEIEVGCSFQLKKGQVITGLDLDLNGKYRKGSIEEKWKAANAYNTVVGKRIDPALLQKMGDNVYRLNVYPVPAYGERRVRIHLSQLLTDQEGELQYELSWPFPAPLNGVSVNANVSEAGCRVETGNGLLEDASFNAADKGLTLSVVRNKVKPSEPIAFSIIPSASMALICNSNQTGKPDGYIRFFHGHSKEIKKRISRQYVFWDVSASMLSRNIDLELAFLNEFIRTYEPAELHVVLFNTRQLLTVPYKPSRDDWFTLASYLKNYQHSGGTDFGALNLSIGGEDPVLVFSDGRYSLSGQAPRSGRSAWFLVNSTSSKPASSLTEACRLSGGTVIQLTVNSIRESVSMAGRINDMSQLSSYIGQLAVISGDPSGNIFAFKGRVPTSFAGDPGKGLSSSGISCDSSLFTRTRMLILYDSMTRQSGWVSVLRFGIREKVVTDRTSFLVLERVEDYKRFNIEPPEEMVEECRQANYVYDKSGKDRLLMASEKEEGLARLKAIVRNELDDVYQQRATQVNVTNSKPMVPVQVKAVPAEAVNNTISKASSTTASVGSGAKELSSVVVTSLGVRRSQKQLGYSVTRVTAKELTQANPVYLANGLTGKVSGLQIQTTNNGVFADHRITLRGIRSLTGNNQPMLVLDGLPVELRMLQVINPNDISNVTILKSSAATAVYGPEGVNGAILIETKTGSITRYQVNWNKTYPLSEAADMEYIDELSSAPPGMLLATYFQLAEQNKDFPIFFFDMASFFFNRGMKTEAMDALHHAVEMVDDIKATVAAAYILESWKEFDRAIGLYKRIIRDNPQMHDIKRDLALAYYQKGDARQAMLTYQNLLASLTEEQSIYSISLQALRELNAIMIAHPEEAAKIDLEPELVFSKPSDLMISMTSALYPVTFEVAAPAADSGTTNAGTAPRSAERYGWNRQYDVAVAKALKGKYSVTVACNNQYAGLPVPRINRLVVFRNFHRGNLSLEIRNINLTYMQGNYLVADLAYE